ncbi:MAG: ABC transporter permease, partial [Peptidiphaga gingivicola]
FELRAVGANPDAAKTAGMSIGKVTTVTLTLSGALCGLAGGVTMTGDLKYLTGDVAGDTGFDAITVALLGRNRPVGTFFAGILFGVFRAGGRTMDAQADVPIDMVLILQSVIVLLIAAPAFVRWLFRLPTGGSDRWRAYLTLAREKAAGQAEASPDSAAQAEDRAPGSGRLRTEAQETDDKKEALK